MDLISLSFIALGLAMDAFSVAVGSGIAIKRLRPYHALKIALFFGIFQFIMPLIGWGLGNAFSRYIQAVDHWIAFILLAFIGGKMLVEAMRGNEQETQKNPLDNKLLTVLAIATSIDALAVGITFASLAMPVPRVFISCTVIGAVALVLPFVGVYIGNKSGNLFGNKAEIAGGIILIGIGLKILIEHMFF